MEAITSNSRLHSLHSHNIHIFTMPVTVTKMTAAEKEAKIMNEIRASAATFEPKFLGSFFGELFGFSVRTN